MSDILGACVRKKERKVLQGQAHGSAGPLRNL